MTTNFIRFSTDTLLGSVQYKKVLSASDFTHVSWSFAGLIREDATGKVYYRNVQDTSDGLLYDFGAQVGDTIPVQNYFQFEMVVDNTDSVLIYGEFKKRIIFATGEIWVEGVGSLLGVLESGHSNLAGVQDVLLCFYRNDTLMYSDNDYSFCYYNNVGVPELENVKVSLYPNPVCGKSVLSIGANADAVHAVVEIYSITGERLRVLDVDQEGNAQIDGSDFARGIYLYRLIIPDAEIVTGKFEVE